MEWIFYPIAVDKKNQKKIKKNKIMCILPTHGSRISEEKKNHNSLHSVDICRLIVVVVVVMSFYFICFQLLWAFFFFLVSIQSISLICVSVFWPLGSD